jgi:predicted nicotinamide N-methyase
MSASFDDNRLPKLNGGWTLQEIDIGWRTIRLALPRDPDALLADKEVLEANRRDDYMPYWASLWPAATEMSRALGKAGWPAGTHVLEIGCGLGLVGIAALLRGWQVLLTDYEPQALRAACVNAELNALDDVQTAVLDWRNPPVERFPIVLACDVLYEQRNHRPLLELIEQTLTACGCCWIGDPGRTPVVDFVHTAAERGFDVVIANAEGERQSFPVRGRFQILQLMRRDDCR